MEEQADAAKRVGVEEAAPVAASEARRAVGRRFRISSLGWWVVALFLVLLLVLGVRAYLGLEALLSQTVRMPQQVVEEWRRLFPQPTPTVKVLPPALEQVRAMARLETTAYYLSTVIAVERPATWPGTGQRLLLVAHGRVVAGVDLSQVQQADVQVTDERVIVRLPKPEILSVSLIESNTYVYDYEKGIFERYDVTLEAEARRRAVAEFERTALANGILGDARRVAEWEVQRLLLLLGYESVTFR